MMLQHEIYMNRCLQLAALGAGAVAPNPMVGAVLVHGNRIIGEGYHRYYGGPHAEVNCLESVVQEDLHLVGSATLYVSLEPCVHFGKTPPCADLVIRNKIPRVVIGCLDPFAAVDGKGAAKLKQAGIEVLTGILEKECVQLNKRFFTFHQEKRPYVILKWAQSVNSCVAGEGKSRVAISNPYTNRLVHRWRTEEAAILVGTNTALIDDPSLTSRLWKGKHPVRLLVDRQLRVPASAAIFSADGWTEGYPARTIVFNERKQGQEAQVLYLLTDPAQPLIPQLLHHCYLQNLQSIIVEGGTQLLQSFINAAAWDEARVIVNQDCFLPGGYPAPVLDRARLLSSEKILSDTSFLYLCDR